MFNKPKVEITINEVENRKRVKLTDNKNKVHRLPTFYDGEDISGKVEIFLTSKTFEHKGVKLQLIGEIKNLQKLKSKILYEEKVFDYSTWGYNRTNDNASFRL